MQVGRKPKFSDEEILDRAMRTFWERGLAEVSIRELERALELTAPSIYRRFGSKEALEVAVVERYVDRVITARVGRHLTGSDDPLDDVQRFLESSVTEAVEGGGLLGCLVTTAGIDARTRSVELRRALDRGRDRIEDGVRGALERADGRGLLAPGTSVADALATVTLAMQGLMAMARAGVPSGELRDRARAVVTVLRASPHADAT